MSDPTVVLEVDPSELDRCTVCGKDTYARGLCREHYAAKNPPAKPAKKPATKKEKEQSQPQNSGLKISRSEVLSMVVVTSQFLSVSLDESFSPGIIDEKGITIYPHTNEAVDQMMPWMEIYGGEFLKALPWFGLIGGCLTIAMPAYEPMAQIIAGVRKPRLFRKPRVDGVTGKVIDPDIFTDRYKLKMASKSDSTESGQKQ